MDKRHNRPKHFFSKSPRSGLSVPGASPEDFVIYASYTQSLGGQCFGTLEVVRKTDDKLLFPFAGAPKLGPYSTREDALKAARELGERIVKGDLNNPES